MAGFEDAGRFVTTKAGQPVGLARDFSVRDSAAQGFSCLVDRILRGRHWAPAEPGLGDTQAALGAPARPPAPVR